MFEARCRIQSHISVWYDDALKTSVHNCVYLFEPYMRYRSTNDQPVVSHSVSEHVEAVRNSLPPAVFERFVRVRVLDGFVRFFFLGRDVDALAIDNIPSYHRWQDHHRCETPNVNF